jgi:hypothetical protein
LSASSESRRFFDKKSRCFKTSPQRKQGAALLALRAGFETAALREMDSFKDRV